jgi:glycine/D-amino acid oxidase-like deaminating enzyme
MAANSWMGWEQLEKEQNVRILNKTGVLWLFPAGQDDQVGNIVSKMEGEGLPFQHLDQRGLKKSYPLIHSEDLHDGIVEQKAGFIHANIATNLVAAQFQKEGGKFVHESVLPQVGKPPATASGKQLGADLYVFASGPWLKNLFPFLPLEISRQEVTYFGADNADVENLIPWIDWRPSDFYYGIPDHGGRGFKLAHDVRGIEMDPTKDDRLPNPELLRKSREYLGHRFPFMKEAPVVESRICQYSNSPDGNFIFDVHPEQDNVFILGGGSGHGFKHGPAIGAMVATSFEKGEIPFTFSLPY